MQLSKLPLGAWIVVRSNRNGCSVVSIHATQGDAETECDKRNEGLSRGLPYGACIAFEPAERMGWSCG
jgi:hypothetical protein